MSWAIGFDENWQRDIGYGVPAYCDYPGCNAEIDRGLSYVCGGAPYGGEDGCGLFFCGKHGGGALCLQCESGLLAFDAKPDHPDWIRHKLTHPSWATWRKENPKAVRLLRKEQGK